jgi:indole-3-glycerol phosphate synthase
MKSALEKICDDKHEHIAHRQKIKSIHDLLEDCKQVTPPRGFTAALAEKAKHKKTGLIAEIKKASPSKGVIREHFEPVEIATLYEQAGATCLSVLTDIPYFQGDDAYMIAARHVTKLPVLRKDFMLDPYQIIESRALGADAVLLIMAALGDEQAHELEALAMDLGMSVLIEVHDEEELHRALTLLKSPLIGINNRNLKTLEVDITTSERLALHIPPDKIAVCESGIKTAKDIERMKRHRIYNFLVGESLMAQDDIAKATRILLGDAR